LFPFLGVSFERWNEPGVKPAESSALVAANDDKMASFCNRALVGSQKKNAAQMPRFSFFLEIQKIETKKYGGG
jgi:hypothetical protein